MISSFDNLPKQLLDTVPALVWASGTDKKCFYFNRSWLEFTGRSLEQEMGDGWTEGLHPDDLKVMHKAYNEAYAKREAFTVEYRLKNNADEYRWILDSASPWFAPNGTFQGYIGSCTDVTKHKRAEENQRYLAKASELLASSLDYRATLKRIAQLAVPEFADWCSVDIVQENGSTKRVALTHINPAKVRWAKELAKEFPPDPNSKVGLPNVIRTGVAELVEHIPPGMLERSATNPRALEVIQELDLRSYMIVPMKIRGRVLGAISFVITGTSRPYQQDDLEIAEELANYAAMAIENSRLYTAARREIEDRIKAEASLRQSEERFRRISESEMLGVVFFDLSSHQIMQANNAFLKMLGYTRTELKQGLVLNSDFSLPEWRPADLAASKQLKKFGTFHPYEKEFLRKDGSRVAVLVGGALFEGSRDQGVSFVLDITDRKKNEVALQHQALHDTLTGLPNRILLEDRLTQAIQQAKRNKKQCAVLFLDLDHFKNINDTLGHHTGDELLIEVSRRLKKVIREEDTLARFGGDEFVILANNVKDPGEAVRIVSKIFKALEEAFYLQSRQIYLNTSIGIAFYPESGKDGRSLIKHADIALYQAKEGGRQGYAIFNASDHFKSGKSLDIETEMRDALKKNQFEVYYQPVLEVQADGTATITGSEALIRWHHPTKGLLLPSTFVPYAEDSGLIHQIGRWMLTSVCKQLGEWKQQDLQALRVSVNISPLEFYRKDFVAEFTHTLAQFGVRPKNLVLEITENLALRNIEIATARLHALKELGVAIAIDDFGIGHSSLNYLKRLPIDKLKIDRSFVQGSPTDAADSAIIQAVGTLARNLRICVVAEGVETAEQFKHLCDIGCCDEMQGFLFSRPLSAENFLRFTQKTHRFPARVRARATTPKQ